SPGRFARLAQTGTSTDWVESKRARIRLSGSLSEGKHFAGLRKTAPDMASIRRLLAIEWHQPVRPCEDRRHEIVVENYALHVPSAPSSCTGGRTRLDPAATFQTATGQSTPIP